MSNNFVHLNDFDVMVFFGIRACVALIAGLIMGIERTMSNHAAGIKTIVFVCMGSSLYSSLAFYLHNIYPTTDPTRIIGQIISGIGFLGAGVIYFSQNKVSGLTSSAMIWTACALGTMAGAGLFEVAIFASLTLVAVTLGLKKLEKYLEKYHKQDKENL